MRGDAGTASRPGASAANRMKIGRYEITERLGKGGFGVVLKGLDPLLKRAAAIKLINEEYVADPEQLKRFLREARAAGKMQHRNIVTVFDLGSHEGRPYIAMEFLEGNDLADIIGRKKPVPLETKIDIIKQVALGLHHAHEHGIVHRDIKPSNIRVLDNGIAKIVDFGVARIESSDVTRTGQVIGTATYMAPEQLTGQRADNRCDLFSLGVVFYELLAYERPFPGNTVSEIMLKILNTKPVPLSLQFLNPEFQALGPIIYRLLEKNPRKRYQTGNEVASALDGVIERAAHADRRRAAPSADHSAAPPGAADGEEAMRGTVKLERPLVLETRGEALSYQQTRIGNVADLESREETEDAPRAPIVALPSDETLDLGGPPNAESGAPDQPAPDDDIYYRRTAMDSEFEQAREEMRAALGAAAPPGADVEATPPTGADSADGLPADRTETAASAPELAGTGPTDNPGAPAESPPEPAAARRSSPASARAKRRSPARPGATRPGGPRRPPTARPRKRFMWVVPVIAVCAVAIGAGAMVLLRSRPARGTVAVETNAVAGWLTVDGAPSSRRALAPGQPNRLELRPGVHTIRIDTPDGVSLEKPITIKARETVELKLPVSLSAGCIKLQTEPASSIVGITGPEGDRAVPSLGGLIEKTTPVDLRAPAGEYTFRFRVIREGVQRDHTRRIVVPPDPDGMCRGTVTLSLN